jgi:hypothetical protein
MSPMRVSSRKLSEELVSRLNDVVPTRFRLTADGNVVHVYIGGVLNSTLSLRNVEDESRDLNDGCGRRCGQ